MTFKEKYIYNCYIETLRKLNNKPYRHRENFDDFETTEDYIAVNKLNNFFNKFPNINIKDFFEAPYFVYNEKYFDLKFYTTQRAIKSYTIYQTTFLPDNPDHEQTLQKIKDSFVFIYKFCKANNISLQEYTSFRTPGKAVNDFLIHLKNRDLIIYALFVLPNFDKFFSVHDEETLRLLFGDLYEKIGFYRTKYYTSSKAKNFCVLAFNKLNSN